MVEPVPEAVFCEIVKPPLALVIAILPFVVLTPLILLTEPIVSVAVLPGLFVKVKALVLPVKLAANVLIASFWLVP